MSASKAHIIYTNQQAILQPHSPVLQLQHMYFLVVLQISLTMAMQNMKDHFLLEADNQIHIYEVNLAVLFIDKELSCNLKFLLQRVTKSINTVLM